MDLHRLPQRGFSLVEFFIIALISTFVMVGSMTWLYKQTDTQLLEQSKTSLFDKHRLIIQRFKKDLNNTVPVTGRSAYWLNPLRPFWAGIMRIDRNGSIAGPRQANEKFDGIRLLSNEGFGYRVNIDAQALALSQTILARNPVKERILGSTNSPLSPDEIFAKNAFRLVRKLIAQSESKLIYTNNSRFSNVTEITGPIVTSEHPNLDAIDEDFTVPVGVTFSQIEYSSEVTSLSPLWVVEWIVNDQNQLIRQRRLGNAQVLSYYWDIADQEIIAENVETFKINYAFSNNRYNKAEARDLIDWPREDAFLSHVRDPRYLKGSSNSNLLPWAGSDSNGIIIPVNPQCAPEDQDFCCAREERCIHWGDVYAVEVELKIKAPLKIKNSRLVADAGNLQFTNGELSWSDKSILFPAQYSVQGQVAESKDIEDSTGPTPNCTADLNNRCKPNNNCKFEGTDPNSPDWEGYGDPSSTYCICGKDQNGIFRAPETLSGQATIVAMLSSTSLDESPFYTHSASEHVLEDLQSSFDNKRLLACLSHFDATKPEGSWLAQLHPLGSLLANQCLDSPEIMRRPATLQEMKREKGYPRWIYEQGTFGSYPNNDTRGDGMQALKNAMSPPSNEADLVGAYASTVRSYVSCLNFQSCDAPLQTLLARFDNSPNNPFKRPNVPSTNSNTPTSVFLPKPFRNFCGCLREDNNKLLPYDYNLRCNIDLRPINVTTSINPMDEDAIVVPFFARNNDRSQILDRPYCRETWRYNEIQRTQLSFSPNNVKTKSDEEFIEIEDHLIETGTPVTITTSSLPGVTPGETYFARPLNDTDIQLHQTAAGAINNTNRVNLISEGSGNHTLLVYPTSNIASKVYRVKDGDNQPQALNNWQEALLCECYAKRFETNPWRVGSAISTDVPQEPIPGLNGQKGRGELVDFRLPEPAVLSPTCGFQTNTNIEGINAQTNNLPWSGLLNDQPWVVSSQFFYGAKDWNSMTLGGNATRMSSGNQGAKNIRVLTFDDSSKQLYENDNSGIEVEDTPSFDTGFCAPALDQPQTQQIAQKFPEINRAPATMAVDLIPDYSSALGACTDPRNTFNARMNRNEISPAEAAEGYSRLQTIYGQSSTTCLDRSSYCSPLCGEGLSDEQLVWTGITQARNFFNTWPDGNGGSTTRPQTHPQIDSRNISPRLCGRRTDTMQPRTQFIAN